MFACTALHCTNKLIEIPVLFFSNKTLQHLKKVQYKHIPLYSIKAPTIYINTFRSLPENSFRRPDLPLKGSFTQHHRLYNLRTLYTVVFPMRNKDSISFAEKP